MSSFDVKCYELAASFLEDYDVMSPANLRVAANRIAQRVQQGIEDDLSDLVAEGKIRERIHVPSAPGIERKEQGR
jgi:hypothetical protein